MLEFGNEAIKIVMFSLSARHIEEAAKAIAKTRRVDRRQSCRTAADVEGDRPDRLCGHQGVRGKHWRRSDKALR
jgi:hypothetical protein